MEHDGPGRAAPTPYGRPIRARKEDDDPVDYCFKIVLVGESMVGKTSLLSRFARNEFCADCKSTIGVEFETLSFWLDSKCIKLQIWDTASQERYRAYTPAYYVGSAGVLLVYDITSRESFVQLRKWLAEVREFSQDDLVVTLVGNKIDLQEKRAVSAEEAAAFCKTHKIGYFETSARDNRSVDELFYDMMASIYTAQSVRDLEHNIGGEALDDSDGIHASRQKRRHVLKGLNGLKSTFRRPRPVNFQLRASKLSSNNRQERALRNDV